MTRLKWWLGCFCLAAVAMAVRADDATVDDEECRLLDIPKCHIHVVDRALLAAERDGVLEEVSVKVGDVVTEGAALVRLRDAIAQAHFKHAQERAGSDVNVRYATEVMETAEEEFE
ncbi:MAG: hypothetical protein KDA75_15660, partial [Planctomycetaceae bacterium]|nr:hypothetical protein [Planctomycetaceae bacterium]